MKKNKKWIAIIAVIVVIVIVCACVFPHLGGSSTNTNSGSTPTATKGSMIVSVTKNKVKISLNSIGTSGTAQVYAYDANEYQTNDKIRGISKSVKAKGTLVGSYKCGTNQTLTRDRYDQNGKDHLYEKYYVVKNGSLLKGPIYATQISSAKKSIAFKQKSIKGIFNENLADMTIPTDLGTHSVTVNINLASLVYANEDPKGKKLAAPAGSLSMKVDGKTYYFNTAYVQQLDANIAAASKAGMNVIAVLAAWKTDDTNVYASSLRYNSPKSTILMGTNTSNSLGREYVIAMMEFLANRYSQGADHGLVSTYVVSNEIDFTHYFYDCGDLDTFMEEYSRSLRLTNLAVKKYASDINVAVPFTHYWAKSSGEMFKECPGESLRPKDMVNWLAEYTNARGAYDWAIAPHCYGTVNSSSNMAGTDVKYKAINGNYKTSPQITYSNFELWNSILSQKDLLYNGKQRSVYLTESGVSSSKGKTLNLNQQAATLSQVYYKVAQMPFVKSFNYYRLNDHAEETKTGLACGLIDDKGKKKPAYTVYKYIDAKDTLKYTNKYLKYIDFKRNGKTEVTVVNGKIKSWKDTMTVYSSDYNWNKNWNMDKVYTK